VIIEFTGASSSGKSYVIGLINSKLNRNFISSYDFILQKLRLNGKISNKKMKSIIVELYLMPIMMTLYFKSFRKYNQLLKIINNISATRMMKINIVRNIFKVHAQYKYLQACLPKQQVCYFDEGPLHQFHNIFIHYDTKLDLELLDVAFNNFQYMTDFTVIITARRQTIVARALEREDAPWCDLDTELWMCYALNAHKFYDHIKEKNLENLKFKEIINDQDIADIHQQIGNLIIELEVNEELWS